MFYAFSPPAVGTNAFNDICDGLRLKSLWQADWRYRYSGQARHLMAVPTVEMDVQVVIPFVSVACAYFIMQRARLVLYGVHQPMLPEQCQCPEYVALVDCLQHHLDICEAQRSACLTQCLSHEDSIPRGAYVVLDEQPLYFSRLFSHYSSLTPPSERILTA